LYGKLHCLEPQGALPLILELQIPGFDASTLKFQKAGPYFPEFSKKSPGGPFQGGRNRKKGGCAGEISTVGLIVDNVLVFKTMYAVCSFLTF